MTAGTARYGHLLERAAGFLEAAGAPLTGEALVAQVLGPAFAGQPALVQSLLRPLAADPRFRCGADGAWALAAWQTREACLTDLAFVVLDVETTGGRTGKHRIVEVAAVKLRRRSVVDEFSSLVNPQAPVPRFVAEFTGITPEMLEDAPLPATVMEALREFVGNAVIVGHNVGSDLTFLNYECARSGQAPFGNTALDTEDLSQRLLPDLRRPSLSRVAGALGHAALGRHRALADTRLTARVFLSLLDLLSTAAPEVTTLPQLEAWLGSRLTERQAFVRRTAAALPVGALEALPDLPGVYTFKDSTGRVLYVGKATSLHDRVAQHFTGRVMQSRLDGLLSQVSSVEHSVVGCELEALLLESERIRRLQPAYNVQERSRKGCPFLRIESGPFPRLSAVHHVADDGAFYLGPYRTTQQVRQIISTLRRVFQIRSCRRTLPAKRKKMRLPCVRLGQGLCPAPCAELVTPEQYGKLVELARLYLQQGRAGALDEIDSRLEHTIVASPGEAAAHWERGALAETRRRLARLRRDYQPIQGGIAGGRLALAYPARTGGAAVLLVEDGRLLGRGWLDETELEEHAIGRLLAGLATETEAEELDADQTNILLRWVHQRADSPNLVPWPAHASAGEIASMVYRVLAFDGAPIYHSEERSDEESAALRMTDRGAHSSLRSE